MSRFFGVLTLCAALAALVGAQDSRPRLSPSEQARVLSRNLSLITATVQNGLEQTESNDSLVHAGKCNTLVKLWAGQVEDAARGNDSARAKEMGEHLNSLVERGVAGNLRTARKRIESGTPMEGELFRRRDEAVKVLEPLEKALTEAARSMRDLQPLLDQVSNSRRNVQSAAEIEKK